MHVKHCLLLLLSGLSLKLLIQISYLTLLIILPVAAKEVHLMLLRLKRHINQRAQGHTNAVTDRKQDFAHQKNGEIIFCGSPYALQYCSS